jgi:hypothetical protein
MLLCLPQAALAVEDGGQNMDVDYEGAGNAKDANERKGEGDAKGSNEGRGGGSGDEGYAAQVSEVYCKAAKDRFWRKLLKYTDGELLRDHLAHDILSMSGRYDPPPLAAPLIDFGLMFNGEFVTPLARSICHAWVSEKLTMSSPYLSLTQTVRFSFIFLE